MSSKYWPRNSIQCLWFIKVYSLQRIVVFLVIFVRKICSAGRVTLKYETNTISEAEYGIIHKFVLDSFTVLYSFCTADLYSLLTIYIPENEVNISNYQLLELISNIWYITYHSCYHKMLCTCTRSFWFIFISLKNKYWSEFEYHRIEFE